MSLGKVVVSVVADTKQFTTAVKGLDGSLRKAILGSAVGNIIADAVRGITSSVISLGKSILDIAVRGGFERALDLQNARAALRGLKLDTETIEVVMGNALDAVRGTAFGLGEAGKVAATAIASGIQPGEDLTRTLSLIADTATIAQTSMGDIGSIFNKVAAGGRVTGEVLNMLESRGVAASAAIAEVMGITREEVSALVSSGKVDFETFQAAMEHALGGAAKNSFDTFDQSLANTKAALSRLSAMFMGPIVENMPQVFLATTGAIDRLAEALKPVAEEFDKFVADTLDKLAGKINEVNFDGFGNSIMAADGPLRTLLTALEPVFEAFKEAGPPIGEVLAIILELAGSLLQALTPALKPIAQLLTPIIEMFGKSLATSISAILELLLPLIEAWLELGAAIMKEVTPMLKELDFGDIVDGLLAFIPVMQELFMAFVPLIPAIGKFITASLPLTGIFLQANTMLLPFITSLVEKLVPAIANVIDFVDKFATGFAANMEFLQNAFNTAKEAFAVGWEAIKEFFAAAWENIKEGFETAKANITSTFTAMFDGLKSAATAAWSAIKGYFETSLNNIRTVVTTVTSAITKAWSTFWNGLKTVVTNISSSITQGWNNAVNNFKNSVSTVTSAFSNIGNAMFNSLKSAFNRIASAWNNTIGKLSFTVPDWVPNMGGSSWSMPKIPALAKGGGIIAGGTVLVGENGPELLNLPKGAAVVPLNRADNGVEDLLRRLLGTGASLPNPSGQGTNQVRYTTVNVGGVHIEVADGANGKAAGQLAADEFISRLSTALQVR